MKIRVTQSAPVSGSYRAARVRSLFNVTPEDGATFHAEAEIPLDDPGWSIGLIVGPSGSGKSSLGRRCWQPEAFHQGFAWGNGPIIDEIAPGKCFDDVVAALSAVGLGSCPSWLRPYQVLSTGERFRAELARLLVDGPQRVVIDEFTSVVDRQIARIGAAAFAKAWRRQPGRQAVLLSCHRDIIDWVQPDWILDTEDMSLQRGALRRSPPITFTLLETNWRPWKIHFERHHYLKLPLMIGATCYVALHEDEPVAHCAVSTCVGLKTARMCRLVVCPEWQGAGVGSRFIDAVAGLWLEGTNRYRKPMTTILHTSHPGLCAALRRNPRWLYAGGRLLGENGQASYTTLTAARQRRGELHSTSRFGGHLRAVQAFRFVGEPAR